jgi:hypothetical protein
MYGDADLPTFFADFGVPVNFQGVASKGNFDRPVDVKLSEQGFGGAIIATPAVRLPYNAFRPMPKSRDLVTVDGTDYTVSEPTSEADGAVVCYELKLAIRGPRL